MPSPPQVTAPIPRAPQPQTTARPATPALSAPIQSAAARAQATTTPTPPASAVPQPLPPPPRPSLPQPPPLPVAGRPAPQTAATRVSQGQIPVAPNVPPAPMAASPSVPRLPVRPGLPSPAAIPPARRSRGALTEPLDAQDVREPSPSAPLFPAARQSSAIPGPNSPTSPPPFPGAQSSFAPPPQSQQPMTLQGDVILDGARVGRWMTSTLARQAARPPAGPTGPDPRQTPLWSGQAQGF